jgi:hypothetical protein
MAARETLTSISGENVVINVPPQTASLTVTVWDRFGNAANLLSEQNPNRGTRILHLPSGDPRLGELLGNAGILRVTLDEEAESHLVKLR